MKPHFLMASLAAASLLLTTGCGEPKKQAPQTQTVAQTGPAIMTSHSNEPIIIDNPNASIGLLEQLSEEDEVQGPFCDEVTLILDHYAYKYLRHHQTSQPIALGNSKITLTFRKNLGSMVIDHVGGNTGSILITPGCANGKLKWKRQHGNSSDGKKRLGLVAKNKGDKYEIESIEYTPQGGTPQTEQFLAGSPVHIRLCTEANAHPCTQ